MEYQELGKGIVKRKEKRLLGLFIDGTGLDRATRRLNRRVDMTRLVKGVTSGTPPVVARYYTLIPYEDDSRQRSFLDAVQEAGLQVVVKRLPPKGVNRQVSTDPEMAADMIAFSLGHQAFSPLAQYQTTPSSSSRTTPGVMPGRRSLSSEASSDTEQYTGQHTHHPDAQQPDKQKGSIKRIVTLVCPSKDMTYPISLAKEFEVDTISVDFGQFGTKDIMRSAAKWIDLSDSETIWKD